MKRTCRCLGLSVSEGVFNAGAGSQSEGKRAVSGIHLEHGVYVLVLNSSALVL